MIRSREIGLFNLYVLVAAGFVALFFWACFGLLQLLNVRNLASNIEPYFAYCLISIGGILFHLYQMNFERLNLAALDPAQNLRLSISQTLFVTGSLALMLVVTKDIGISRLFLLTFVILLPIGLFALNATAPGLLCKMFFGGSNETPTLLIGRTDRVGRVRRWLRRLEGYGIHVAGLLTEEDTSRVRTVHRIPILGSARDLDAILAKVRIEIVILLDVPESRAVLDTIVDATERAGVRMVVCNNLSEMFRHSLRFYRQFGVDFFTLREEPLQDPLNRLLKRGLDVTVSLLVTLLVLPLLAVFVAIVHRMQSPGPLFFRQVRAGIQNRRFEILKFRTMHTEEFDATRQATKDDPRIFPLGRFLRKTSIDEIPQFLNVLRGEMSVVGPRPHMIEHNEQFARALSHYHVRTLVKPGVTGLAQVSGFRGEAHTDEDIARRVACDIDYIERWSLLMDLGIILQTAWQIVRPPKSAY